MKKTLPLIPVGHPEFKWTSGADVQSTWNRYTGWVPPSGSWIKPVQPIVRTPTFAKA